MLAVVEFKKKIKLIHNCITQENKLEHIKLVLDSLAVCDQLLDYEEPNLELIKNNLSVIIEFISASGSFPHILGVFNGLFNELNWKSLEMTKAIECTIEELRKEIINAKEDFLKELGDQDGELKKTLELTDDIFQLEWFVETYLPSIEKKTSLNENQIKKLNQLQFAFQKAKKTIKLLDGELSDEQWQAPITQTKADKKMLTRAGFFARQAIFKEEQGLQTGMRPNVLVLEASKSKESDGSRMEI